MEGAIKFLDNPKNFYEPNEKLKALVTLTVPRTEKINRINCKILGYAKTKWYESKPVGNSHRIDVYKGWKDYIKEEFCLVGEFEDNQVELTAGEHNFNISYALGECPTSFKCKNGSIKYKIRVTVDRPWKVNSKFEFPFTVIRPFNLNAAANYLRNPLKHEMSKNFTMDFTSEQLYISASIPFLGYVPGQCIHVDVNINNKSNTHVKEVKVTLKKIITLNGECYKAKSKLFFESEVKVSSDAPVPVSSMKNFEIKVEVPSLSPDIDSEVIRVHYELQIKAKTGGLSRSPRFNLPITVGTLPLENPQVAVERSPAYSSLLPPSYEEAVRDGAGAFADNSDDEDGFNPRYPVFKFADSSVSKNKE